MGFLEQWSEALRRTLEAALERVALYLPNLLGALLLLAIGWVVARIARAFAARGVMLLDVLLARVLPAGRGERPSVAGSATTIGDVVFWVVVLLFVAAITQVLGLEAFTAWLARVLDYLPTFAAGVLIVVVGALLGRFVHGLVLATAARVEPRGRQLLARTAQGAILVTAILVGADQIGVRVTFLMVLVGAAALAVAGGVALATSLGARDYVANLIGGHHLQRAFEVGQRVRVAGFEGRILDLTPVSLVLETPQGRVTLPARVYNEQPIELVLGDG